jgi:hypothetical protein
VFSVILLSSGFWLGKYDDGGIPIPIGYSFI